MLLSGLRRAARRPIQLVTSVDQCQGVVERLLNSGRPSVAVDCEGTQLGRFGRLSLVQLATEEEIFLVDVEQGGTQVVEPLVTLLESREVAKVFHDCREDSALLHHQFGASMAAVFDTQVGHALSVERQGLEPYQAGLGELLRLFLMPTYRSHRWDDLEAKPISPKEWSKRPLAPRAVRYAVEGVAHLLPLQRAISQELGDPSGDLVMQRSSRYVDYAHLNSAAFSTQDISGLRPGAPLGAMLASRRPDSAYFKLNHGTLTGVVLDPTDLKDFVDLQPGDVANCRVKSLSECQQYVNLQREGHGELSWDMRKREMVRMPSMEDLEQMRPRRQSTMYGFGRDQGGGASITEERSNYRDEKPNIVFRSGKRGVPKVRDNSIKAPKRRGGTRLPE